MINYSSSRCRKVNIVEEIESNLVRNDMDRDAEYVIEHSLFGYKIRIPHQCDIPGLQISIIPINVKTSFCVIFL